MTTTTTESPSSKRPTGLGRGLSSLLGEVEREEPVGGGGRSGVMLVETSSIDSDPGQPRRHFDEEALDQLAASISARGLIQPIVVRPRGARYQIVAGERRWRAAQRVRLHQVPVIIREFSDLEALEVALLENIQREDLNAIEEAEGYRRLITELGHSQEALGRLVHKSRSHVANLLRLLDLPAMVREAVADGRLSMGHARAIAASPDPEALACEVIAKGLSVREAEKLARGVRPPRPSRARVGVATGDADIEALERQLGDMTGLRVKISHGGAGGTVSLSYATLDQLDMICQRLSGEPI